MFVSKFILNCIQRKFLARCLSSDRYIYPVVKFTKIIHPGDTQMLGMVQGGLVLKLLEESADIAATKHCMRFGMKDKHGNVPHPALVGVERVEFLGSGKVGELMEFTARVIHVRERSLRIYVDVITLGDDLQKKLVNRALLWYVPISTSDGTIGHFQLTEEERTKLDGAENKPERHPKFSEVVKDFSIDDYLDISMQEYLNNLKMAKDEKIVEEINRSARQILENKNSRVTMYSISPSHCSLLNRCRAGEILRWIDEYGATIGSFNVGRLSVTGSMDSCIMSSPVLPGSCISFISRPVFSSQRTMDVQVIGLVEDKDSIEPQVFTDAFLTIVVPRKNEKDDFVLPPLKLESEEAKQLFERRKLLHQARKMLLLMYKQKQ